MQFLDTERKFWDDIAQNWSIHNKNPVVGWYDFHNNWSDYDTVLFEGIDTHGKVALEYGCGPARNLIKFGDPKWGFKRIDGVDISDTNVRNAWINFRDVGFRGFQEKPNIWQNDGCHLDMCADASYDIVFSVIALQHIQSHPIRQIIFQEINRVLKSGGVFTAQMGFGPGHPRSVDYYHVGETHFDGDTRVESYDALEMDLKEAGFTNFRYQLRPPCKDEHPYWIWFKVDK